MADGANVMRIWNADVPVLCFGPLLMQKVVQLARHHAKISMLVGLFIFHSDWYRHTELDIALVMTHFFLASNCNQLLLLAGCLLLSQFSRQLVLISYVYTTVYTTAPYDNEVGQKTYASLNNRCHYGHPFCPFQDSQCGKKKRT